MQSSKQQFQEQLITPIDKQVETVPQLEYAYYRFNINMQRYYSLTLLKSAYTIISLGFALNFDIPCFQNYFFITELTWVINSFLLKAFYTSSPHIMVFRAVSAFGFLLLLFCLFSYFLINQDKLWGDGWIIEFLWTIHLIFYCFFLPPSIKMMITWLRYRKWSSEIVNSKSYELKELIVGSFLPISQKSNNLVKDLNLNPRTFRRSKSHFGEKNKKGKQKNIGNYSSMSNIE